MQVPISQQGGEVYVWWCGGGDGGGAWGGPGAGRWCGPELGFDQLVPDVPVPRVGRHHGVWEGPGVFGSEVMERVFGESGQGAGRFRVGDDQRDDGFLRRFWNSVESCDRVMCI